MDDEDTWASDTEVGISAVMLADTDEWEHTDREIEAQGTIDTDPQVFEDTGVVIISKPDAPAKSEHLLVTFRQPSTVSFREPAPRAARAPTSDEWPPSPREPAQPIRERALKSAGVYTVIARAETNKS
ncbi:MAG: hypothetical protein M4D80_01550 [Myxococcota bacterium]|nr:hypothetical protein [Myxococcota bacterium]